MDQFYWGQNLRYLRKQKNLTQAQIADSVGFKPSQWGNWEIYNKFPSVADLIEISKYFGISESDLLHVDLQNAGNSQNHEIKNNGKIAGDKSGNDAGNREESRDLQPEYYELAESEPGWAEKNRKKGEVVRMQMPRVITLDTSGEENAVLVPVRARAGYLNGYGDPRFIEKLPSYKIWGHTGRTYRIFEVDGNSMFNTLHDGDKVKAYWVSISDIRRGQIYVVVTQSEGILVKRIISSDDSIVVLKSDNNHHGENPPIVLDIHEVRELWHVEEYTSRMMGEPGEWYQRMIALEADVAIMKQKMLKGN